MKIERQNAVDQATESTRYTDKVPKPADGSKKHPGYYTYTDKERLFVFHYLETTNFNAKEAAVEAGYSDAESDRPDRSAPSSSGRKTSGPL
jgi:hypothetical protein